jgi:hypothetical protein
MLVLTAAVALSVIGCGKREQEPADANAAANQTLEERASQALQDTTDFVAQQKDKLVASAQEQLDKLETQFNDWLDKAGIEDEQAKQTLDALNEKFKAALGAARGALDTAKEAGAEAWQEAKPALELALEEAQRTFDELVSYIKSRAVPQQEPEAADPAIE